MKVVDPGHEFLLDCLDAPSGFKVHLPFVKRVGERYPGNATAHAGPTSQEVLRALISRAKYVNQQTPCNETRVSVWLMRAVIWLYERRAKRIKGYRMPLRLIRTIELLPTCRTCGHVGCSTHVGLI